MSLTSLERHEAIKDVGMLWKYAFSYKKEFEDKLVFYVKDFYYKDADVRRVRDICRMFKNIMEQRHNLLIKANDERMKEKFP